MKKLYSISIVCILAIFFVYKGNNSNSNIHVSNSVNKLDNSSDLNAEETKYNNLYINKIYNYSIKLPEKIYINCDFEEIDNSKITTFYLKDENDMIMAIITIPDKEYKNDNMLGVKFLGSKNGFTTYIQLPTCGTISDESLRDLWNELVEQAGKIDEKNIIYN